MRSVLVNEGFEGKAERKVDDARLALDTWITLWNGLAGFVDFVVGSGWTVGLVDVVGTTVDVSVEVARIDVVRAVRVEAVLVGGPPNEKLWGENPPGSPPNPPCPP